MTNRPAAPPLFAVLARTPAGHARLSAEALQPWVRAWLPDPDPAAWWIDADAGVAVFRPEKVAAGPAVLTIRGSLLGAPSRKRQPGDDAASALVRELVERDVNAVDALRGQFCLALWDGARRRLLLARDHLGQRSIFYRTTADAIVFCSDLEPLLRSPEPSELDPEGAFWFLAFGMPPPGRTLVTRVDRLPAAHTLVCEPDRAPMLRRYWTPLDPNAPRDATPDVVDAIRAELDLAIGRRLSHSHPAGVLLSGGVDSTYVTATAVALGIPPAYAFTSEFDPAYAMNETEYAAAVAEWLAVTHEVVPLDGARAAALLNDVLDSPEPPAAWATVTHLQILDRAQELGVGMLLSGLGADEIFGGYDHFRGFQARFLRYAKRNPAPPGLDDAGALLLPEGRASARVLYPGVARFFDDTALRRSLEEPYRRWQYASHLAAFYRECRRLKPEAQYIEMMIAHECQHRIPDMLFAHFEHLSRRAGIEVRYPFLDPDVVRGVAGLAIESRYRTATGKFSLRLRDLQPQFKYAMLQVAADRVPREILERRRKSFTAPFGGWMTEPEFARPVLDALQRSRFWKRGIVKRSWLARVLERIGPFPSPSLFQLWSLVALAGWYDRYIEAP